MIFSLNRDTVRENVRRGVAHNMYGMHGMAERETPTGQRQEMEAALKAAKEEIPEVDHKELETDTTTREWCRTAKYM